MSRDVENDARLEGDRVTWRRQGPSAAPIAARPQIPTLLPPSPPDWSLVFCSPPRVLRLAEVVSGGLQQHFYC